MINLQSLKSELAKRQFREFVLHTKKNYNPLWFHELIMEKLDAFAKGKIKRLAIFIPPQHGKFLPYDTPILTSQGWKNHIDLKEGDYVFGQDGKLKKVLANSGGYDWNVVEVYFQDGKKIKCAKEHLWKVKVDYDDKKGRREIVTETQKIFSKRHRRSPYIDVSPALETTQKELPIDPYVLGCWLGDGHSRQGVLTVGSQDIEHFAKLGEAREVKKGIYRVLISDLTTKLRLNNLLLNKHIPIDYLLASKEQRENLLQGLMDTDGCTDKRGNCEFTQKNNQLVEDVYILLRSLGYKARKNYYRAKIEGRDVGLKCRITFNPDKTDKVFQLPRKQERIINKTLNDRDDKKKLFISEIGTNTEKVFGNCIEVEGGMYLAGYDLIPTHNSELSSRRLPSYILGIDPNKKIAVCGYSDTFVRMFNRDIQRIIESPEYSEVFPKTKLNSKNIRTANNYLKNSDIFEIVGSSGFLVTTSIGGALTGKTIDVLIIDDPVKNMMDAESNAIQEKNWDWFLSVADTRLSENGQILILQTLWNQEDLGSRVIKNFDDFEVVKIQALKREHETPNDPREYNEPLWAKQKNKESLLQNERLSPKIFNCMYQQNTEVLTEFKIAKHVKIVSKLDEDLIKDLPHHKAIDFGFTSSKLAGVDIWYTKETIYARMFLYTDKTTNQKLAKIIKENYDFETVYCDAAEPKSISELEENGINAVSVPKFQGSVNAMILYFESFEVIIEGCEPFEFETNNWKWKVDSNGKPKREENDKHNHLYKALLYGIWGYFKTNQAKVTEGGKVSRKGKKSEGNSFDKFFER